MPARAGGYPRRLDRRSGTTHAKFQLLVAVHAENANGCATGSGFTNQMDSVPSEVILPALLPRVKQRSEISGKWINAGEIRAFVKIAINAGEAEVGGIVASAMLERPDMFDMQCRQRRVVLMKATILAVILRAFAHEGPGCRTHAALPDLNFFASRRRTATNLLART